MLFNALTNSKLFLDYCSHFFKILVDRLIIFMLLLGYIINMYTWTTPPLVTLRTCSFFSPSILSGFGNSDTSLTFCSYSVCRCSGAVDSQKSQMQESGCLPPFPVYSSSHAKVIRFWWKRLQLLREKVHYLGHDLIAKGISLSSEIIKAAPSFL